MRIRAFDKITGEEVDILRYDLLKSVNVKRYSGLEDGAGVELWSGDRRILKGKEYTIVDYGWKMVFDRSMAIDGDNDTVDVDEDSAWISRLKHIDKESVDDNHEMNDLWLKHIIGGYVSPIDNKCKVLYKECGKCEQLGWCKRHGMNFETRQIDCGAAIHNTVPFNTNCSDNSSEDDCNNTSIIPFDEKVIKHFQS